MTQTEVLLDIKLPDGEGIEVLKQVLNKVKNNKNHTAQILQINRTTLYSKIKKFKLDVEDTVISKNWPVEK